MYVCIPGEFMSATQKSWRGLGSNAMACSHEASAKMAARRSSMEEEEEAIAMQVFRSLAPPCCVYRLGDGDAFGN